MVRVDTPKNDIDFEVLGFPENYTELLNQLEKLAQDVSDRERSEGQRMMSDAEYSRFVSDIWIGVVLTLLILTVVFFICSCFLYHKFQQWKSSCVAAQHNSHLVEGIQRFEFEVESLPSYTIVSGLPTYDDALEQFRKNGSRTAILLQPSVIKIFDENNKKIMDTSEPADTQSIASCSCSASNPSLVSSVIELRPDQLKALSQKRLSLQIAFNSSIRNSGRSRVDLCREVNRNNLLRSHDLPPTHRSTSSLGPEDETTSNRFSVLSHRGSFS